MLVGSGASWRSVAKGIEKEASQMGLNGVKKSLDDAVLKMEKASAKTKPNSVYDKAKNGGDHNGLYKEYLKRSDKEVQNAVTGYAKQIEKHKKAIADPESVYPKFKQQDIRAQQHQINTKWPDDIKRL